MKKIILLGIILSAVGIAPILTGKHANQAIGQCQYEQAQRAGCCSRHGGVCGCNTSVHKLKCCDGTSSPSCGC